MIKRYAACIIVHYILWDLFDFFSHGGTSASLMSVSHGSYHLIITVVDRIMSFKSILDRSSEKQSYPKIHILAHAGRCMGAQGAALTI